jgi:hypothetical protein
MFSLVRNKLVPVMSRITDTGSIGYPLLRSVWGAKEAGDVFLWVVVSLDLILSTY